MVWTILIIKKSDNGWYINYIEQKIIKQISINNLQNFVDVIVFDPKIKFSSKYVSVIDNYVEITDSFIFDIYNIMSNSNADCIGLKGLNYIDGNSCTFSNISDGSSLLLPITTLNPIKLDIIVSKLQNIHYYINSENLSNIIQSIDNIKTSVVFMQDTTNKLPFSIIITAYQTQNYIEDCLDSIENQTHFKENDNYEVLVGVDACQETFDKLNEIKHKYRNLKIYMMNDNKGTYITTNTLIGLTKYENIIRFDSDDIMTPNLVKELVKDKGSSDIVILGYFDFENGVVGTDLALAGIIYFKKGVMDIAGGYQPWRCAADTELISRLANKVKISQLKKAVFYRRIHENSLTRRDDTKHDSEIRNYYTSLIKRNYSDNEIKIERVVNDYHYKKPNIYNLSIIITAYQTQEYIEDCLDSIENQTQFKHNDNYEVLVGVDGCKYTLNKLNEIKHKYRNLRIFMMDSNKGTYVTSNTLLDLTKYENIIRFDSDDIMKYNMIEVLFGYLDDEHSIYRFGYDNFCDNNIIISNSIHYPHGVVCYKKYVFDIVGGYQNWTCAADTELIERIKEHVKIKMINSRLFLRRRHENSLTRKINTKHGSEIRNNYKQMIGKHKSLYIDKIKNTYVEY